jgi:histidine triad (HIT) family protein
VVSGFGVAHAHLLVVPLHAEHDVVSGRHAFVEDGEVRFSANRVPAVPRAELDEMARRLATSA